MLLHRRHLAGLLVPTLALAGCATYRPQPLDPTAELAALARRDLAVVVQEPSPLGPVDLGNGLDERELVAIALRLNPDLAERRAGLGLSEAALIEAGLWPNPEVGVTALGGSPGFSLDLDLLQPLLRPGERQAKREVAEADQRSARAELTAAEWTLVAEVRSARMDLLAAMALQGAAEASARIAAQAAQAITAQRALGETNDLDVAQATWESAEAAAAVRTAQAEVERGQQQLNRLLGLPPQTDLTLTGAGEPLVWSPPALLPAADLGAAVLDGRWELTVAKERYVRADAALRVALAKQYPSLRLGPALSHDDTGTGVGIGASLDLPIFDRNQGGIRAAEAERDQALAAYRGLLHRLTADAAAAQADLERATAVLSIRDRDLLPAANQAMALADRAVAAHEWDLSTWLNMRRRWIESQRSRLDAVLAAAHAGIALDAALGRAPHAPARPTENRQSTESHTP